MAEAAPLAVTWNHGAASTRRDADPALQVYAYAEHTVILRQSKGTSYEAPFLFLLFGNDRALLLDTGATDDPAVFPLRATVDRLVAEWLERHPREGYELVVAHTHGHGDHVAADGQFADRPATTVVPREVEAVHAFFAIDGDDTVTFELGGRALEVIPSPGHHKASVTFYDPWTGILFTGDTVLPGRLYVFDPGAYRSTLERLVAFAVERPVTHVLGCHVEMKGRPRRDFPIGAVYQPGERRLELTPEHLRMIRDAAVAAGDRPGVFRYDDFLLYDNPGQVDLLKLVGRGRVAKAWRRVRSLI